jgi:2-keto-4-pentenoate hydratase/2-oxohepta-3-ene-1,7-dioic acid hydratase in catechol pathway
MKLIRFGEIGTEKPGLLLGDEERIDVSELGEDFDERFFASGGLARLERWSQQHAAHAPRVAESTRWGAPVARPSKLICIGLNYRDHARETGAQIPAEPIIFFKATSAIVGPNDNLVIPRGSEKTDWEVELAVVIGQTCRYVAKQNASDYIAGYTLHNDYSERAFQLERGGQWVKGKSADSFAPLGPFVATPDELANVGDLPLWLEVNGERVQSGNTSDMIFGVDEIVSTLSHYMTLLPGDVISTGTPAGVGMGMKPQRFLSPGDVCEPSIVGLGRSRQQAIAAPR